MLFDRMICCQQKFAQ